VIGMSFPYELLIVDLDGVVWRGGRIIERNVEALRILNDLGVKLVFASNNSSISRRGYAAKLTDILGFKVPVNHVFNSGYLASKWIMDNYGSMKVYPIGEDGLIEELTLMGHMIIDDVLSIEAVVVGLDRNLTYKKLETAHKAITMNKALFVACNDDHVLPVDEGTIPGAGAIVAFLVKSTGLNPIFTAGKPNRYLADLLLKSMGVPKDKVLVVGDRCDMDVTFALNSGLDSLLVFTGLTKPDTPLTIKPKYAFMDLLEFVEFYL
jgi:4-nitrophenyl phosphatase